MPCNCQDSAVMGYPCPHVTQQMMSRNYNIRVEDFHPFWAWCTPSLTMPGQSTTSDWDRVSTALHAAHANGDKPYSDFLESRVRDILSEPVITLKEPEGAQPKGRPKSKSTKRDPSAFEYAESPRRQNKCSHCHKGGHYCATCPLLVISQTLHAASIFF